MGRSITATFVGAYIRLGEKEEAEVVKAFEASDYSEDYNGIIEDYINDQFSPLNYMDTSKVICPSDGEAEITGEITAETAELTVTFVKTKHAEQIAFLQSIYGSATVKVGVVEYEDEIG